MKRLMKRVSTLLGVALVLSLVLTLALPTAALADYIDTTGPTGSYYQYAGFTRTPADTNLPPTSVYKGGGDVDAYGDLLYVNRDGYYLDVYEVTLLDTDGDGILEPDQHPLNPDDTGDMEERTLALVTTYDVPELVTATIGEIYAVADRIYFLGEDRGDVYQYVFSSGVTSKVVDSVYFNLSHLGYDDVNDKWYASYEQIDPSPPGDPIRRAVYSWDGSDWVFEFDYLSLGGGHSDGLEVITDPATNIPYVYVSDMTSDYIGQWRYDTDTSSWVEQNLFMYVGAYGNVEGMGFGALGHFWVTTGFANAGTLYEIGGGELGGYIPPVRDLVLSPLGVTNEVGESHTVTATALLNEEPVEGVEVTFTVTGAHSTGGTSTTDATGHCTFSYTGSVEGDDTIVATATIDGQEVTSNEVSKTWEITNQAPVADPNGPYLGAAGSPIPFDGTGSSDPDSDPLTYDWDWGDSSTSPDAGATPTYTYADAGIYDVCLTVSDGMLSDMACTWVVVYDSEGGFVTGGGWIDSPEGAYAAEPTLTGRANFGFVSKYHKGATTPTGQTEFQFKVADLNFHSDTYQWLVVAGARAQYKGTGTINGEGNYGFMLTAIDEKLTPSTDVDMFRIKIWDKDNSDAIVYDNQSGDADDADPTTGIAGGNIVIHKK